MKTAPLSVLHTIASHYEQDARDFLERFNLLWEAQLHKTGRIKSFVDLLLACECMLKCHIVLQQVQKDPKVVYKEVRSYRHDIQALAHAATYLQDRTCYVQIEERLSQFSVFIRYSLDAYETFFPSALERSDALINYSATIGNNPWVLASRDLVASALSSTHGEFQGLVTDNLSDLLQHDLDMQKFVEECMR